MSLIHFFFSFRGRISRLEWWLGCGALGAFSTAVIRALDPDYFDVLGETIKPPTLAVTLWNLLVSLSSAAISVKRFNDRDLPGWTGVLLCAFLAVFVIGNYYGFLLNTKTMVGFEKMLFVVIMIYFLWAFYDNAFLRGTPGWNRHGVDPYR